MLTVTYRKKKYQCWVTVKAGKKVDYSQENGHNFVFFSESGSLVLLPV